MSTGIYILSLHSWSLKQIFKVSFRFFPDFSFHSLVVSEWDLCDDCPKCRIPQVWGYYQRFHCRTSVINLTGLYWKKGFILRLTSNDLFVVVISQQITENVLKKRIKSALIYLIYEQLISIDTCDENKVCLIRACITLLNTTVHRLLAR